MDAHVETSNTDVIGILSPNFLCTGRGLHHSRYNNLACALVLLGLSNQPMNVQLVQQGLQACFWILICWFRIQGVCPSEKNMESPYKDLKR